MYVPARIILINPRIRHLPSELLSLLLLVQILKLLLGESSPLLGIRVELELIICLHLELVKLLLLLVLRHLLKLSFSDTRQPSEHDLLSRLAVCQNSLVDLLLLSSDHSSIKTCHASDILHLLP